MSNLPVVDISSLFAGGKHARRKEAVDQIGSACRDTGFFYAKGHAIAPELIDRLYAASRRFFALPEATKMKIAMAKGGSAWRGYFPLRGELTSGKPDLKEGIYFGEELGSEDARVRAGLPLHGGNLFPAEVPDLRGAVLEFMSAATRSGHALMEGIAESLDLEADYFAKHYTSHPTLLFRVFHYPGQVRENNEWGVGEHTDYGLLTLLAQDNLGGLQVKSKSGWIDAPPIPGTLVCNIGDMLDRLTGGFYRSTPHRVRNVGGNGRLSFPLFFDPDFSARIVPLPQRAASAADDSSERWDRANVHAFEGTYGDYLMAKIARVFPDLKRDVLPGRD
ncbi:MAG: isopenicillin N synthase family oxygenase [Alphaproteobacteria bacterium]|nr:isopenicillin N synthase family oxygenase [Alphaproteobacteria bacterium]